LSIHKDGGSKNNTSFRYGSSSKPVNQPPIGGGGSLLNCVSENYTDVAHYSFNAHKPFFLRPYDCQIYSKPKHHRFKDTEYITEKTISGVHVSPRRAEILVSRCGIANHRLIVYSLSNISTKNYQNRSMWLEVIVCNISVVFLRHRVVQYVLVGFVRILYGILVGARWSNRSHGTPRQLCYALLSAGVKQQRQVYSLWTV